MAACRFSRRAETDLLGIATYTLETWGEEQAARYVSDLETCCLKLAENPALGQACDYIRSRLRRMVQGKHVVFYREEPDGILVSRILHQRMLPERYVIED